MYEDLQSSYTSGAGTRDDDGDNIYQNVAPAWRREGADDPNPLGGNGSAPEGMDERGGEQLYEGVDEGGGEQLYEGVDERGGEQLYEEGMDGGERGGMQGEEPTYDFVHDEQD